MRRSGLLDDDNGLGGDNAIALRVAPAPYRQSRPAADGESEGSKKNTL